MKTCRDFFIGIIPILIIAFLMTAGCVQNTAYQPPATLQETLLPGTTGAPTGTPLSTVEGSPVSSPVVTPASQPNGTIMNTMVTPGTSIPVPSSIVTTLTGSTTSATDGTTAAAGSTTGTTQPAGQGNITQTTVSTTQPTLATTTLPQGTPVPTTASTTNTVIAVLAADERFSTLVRMLGAADLGATLNGSGPFTVFAPTNEAFNVLPAGSLDDFLADPGGQLSEILRYHVVSGKYSVADLSGVSSLTTLQGEKISIEVVNGTVMIDEIRVIIPDTAAGNGVIHGIEGVLIPSSL